MKKMILVLLIALTAPTFAGEKDHFLKVKARLLQRLDDRISLYTRLRACMDDTSDKKGLKTCGQKFSSEVKALSSKK